MKIFNYKIINYKRFSAFFLILSFIVSSVSFLVQKPHTADAAITDCTTEVGNMITNCSFENPAVLPAGYTPSGVWGYPTFFSGYTGLTGWSFITPGTGNVTMATGFAGSAQGSRAVDVSGVIDTPAGLNGEIYGSGIEQTVTGLTPGMQYSLKFYQSHLTLAGVTYPSRINVVVDGTSLGIFSHTISTAGDSVGGQVWTQRAVTFIATGTSAVIRFLNDVPTPAPADGAGRPVDLIDNIILETKPDTTAPTLSLSPTPTTVTGPFTATVCPSEPLNGATLTLSDFVISDPGLNTLSGLTGPTTVPTTTCASGEIYTITVTPGLPADGTITISIPASSVQDIAGNVNTVPSNTLTATYDIVTVVISPVHIESNNTTNNQYATTGDVITLTYTIDVGSASLATHTVTIGGQSVTPLCTGSGPSNCTATVTVTTGIPATDGVIPFTIIADSQTTTGTTDGSQVTVDRSTHVLIISPGVGDYLPTFLLGGECEIGAGDVTISGTGFTPSPVTVPCVDQGDTYGWFEYDPMTGIPGTITITATQTDLAGNVGTDTNIYTLASSASLPTVTINSPHGVIQEGSSTISGTCSEIGQIVTISGSGFEPTGTTLCLITGTYEYDITIIGNTSINASQTNSIGTAVATTTTRLPRGGSSGGCEPGSPCDTGNSNNSSNTQIDNSSNNVEETNNENSTCPAFTQYLKQGMRDGQNGVSEVSKVQKFLNRNLGIVLSIDGIFGKRTRDAVKSFQSMHFAEVLAPWALSGPTGWWYQSTRGYANFIENCSEGIVQLDNSVKVQDGKILN